MEAQHRLIGGLLLFENGLYLAKLVQRLECRAVAFAELKIGKTVFCNVRRPQCLSARVLLAWLLLVDSSLSEA